MSCVPDDASIGNAFVTATDPLVVLSCSNAGDPLGSEYVAGTVLADVRVDDVVLKKTYADTCVNDNLIEYVCDNSNKIVLSSSYLCEAGCSTSAFGGKCNSIPAENCDDGIDNDFDGFIDCSDETCFNNSACSFCVDQDTSVIDLNNDGNYDLDNQEFQNSSLFVKSKTKGVVFGGETKVEEDSCSSSGVVTEHFCTSPSG